MKKLLFSLLALFSFALISPAQIFTEQFEYLAGSTLDSNGWAAHSGSSGPISVDVSSLTFTQYSPTSIGGSAVSSGTSQDVNQLFGEITAGDIYVSFLLKLDTVNNDGYFFHLMDSTGSFDYRGRVFFQEDANNSNAYNLGLSFGSSTATFDTTEFSTGSTILVVLKYSIVAGGNNNDEVSLFAFDPTGSFMSEPNNPLIGPETGSQSDINPARIALRQFSGNGGFTVDAFSVDTVWNMSPAFTLDQISLPITWDDATTDYGVTDFGGNASMVVPSPTNSSNNVLMSTKGGTAQLWAGTTLGYDSSAFAMGIPFSAGNTLMKVAVWSPDANIPIRLKAEDKTNAGISVETEATVTTANAWDTLTFDFSNQVSGTAAINFANTYDKLSIFYNFGTDGATAGSKTYYCDNVWFAGGSASTAQIDLPITWDDTSNVDYTTTDFGGNSSTVVVSPTLATNNVLEIIKSATAQLWAGTTLSTPSGLANPIPFSAGNTEMKVAFWSPDSGTVVRLKAEDHTNAGISVETEATTTMAAAWDTLTFDFSNQVSGTAAINFANTYDMVSIFCGFGTAGSGTAKTYYVDNVWFAGTSGPPPSNNSPYCNTQVYHFGNTADVTSSVFLTIKNTGSNSMEVVIESATSDPVDDLIIPGGSGAAISAIDTPSVGQLRRILTWTTPPPTVDLNVLWSKGTFGGNWQLIQVGNLSIPFSATCIPVIPTKAIIDLPITWDDSANVDYTVTDFGGNISMHVVDPTNASNMVLQSTKDSTAQLWAGTTLGLDSTGLATAIPFVAGSTIIKVAVWSPDANIPIRLKAEDKTNPAISVETEATVMNASVWDTLTFDFSNQVSGTAAINFANTYDKLSIFYNFGTTGAAAGQKTYYCDDVWFMAMTPPPGLAIIDLPITWDDTANVDYTVTDFGGNISMHVVDPTNASNMVLQSTKDSTAQLWAGTTLGLDSTGLATAIPFAAGSTTISVAVWSPDANIPIRLKAEDKTNPAISVETEATVMNASVWDTLIFDFSNQVSGTAAINFANTYDKLSIFYNFGTTGAAAGQKTYFCDDVYFGSGGGSGPMKAQIDLPITWNDTANVDYSVTDFGGTNSALVPSPTNSANLVLSSLKDVSAQSWAGTTLSTSNGLATAIPFSASATTISALVYSPDAGIIVRLKAEDKSNSAIFVEAEATIASANTWDTLVFDFSNNVTTPVLDTNNTYDLLSIFYDFNVAPSNPAKTYYLDDVFFGGGSVPPPAMHNVTFQVDLSEYMGAYSQVNLNGTFNNWCGTCAVMTDANNDSIFDITVSLPAGDTSEFKYTLDGWTVDEQLTQGDPCTKTTIDAGGTFTNRFIVPTADTTLPAVCWESCSTCSGIGIDEDIWSESLRVSPNPSTGTFNISGVMKVTTHVEIIITNVQGQVVYHSSETKMNLDQDISLKNAANGLYMVNIITDYGMFSEKVIINK